MRFDLQKGFPLLTTKEIKFNSVKAELLWFIDAGKDTDHRLSLAKLNMIQGKHPDAKNIWSHDQARFATQGKARFYGDCGRIYGAQWRNWRSSLYFPSHPIGAGDDMIIAPEKWDNREVDQLKKVIEQIKKDPFSRYHIITAWNPGELDEMCLPPCHMKMQFFVREIREIQYLDLSMDQRSCDLFLGVPFNVASYALLLHMVAQCVNMQPGELVITLEDCHIYLTNSEGDATKGHLDKVDLQLSRDPYPLPTLWLNPDVKDIDMFKMEDIDIKDYVFHPFIKADLL